MSVTEQLARFAIETAPGFLDSRLIASTRSKFFDTIAVMVAGARHPAAQIAAQTARQTGGNPDVIAQLLANRLSEMFKSPFIVEDVPGVGKTLLVKALARAVAGEFQRIQFTSDLLPADILGNSIFERGEQRFVFHRGPLFSQMVLIDEVNRATAKTQSALLEAIEGKRAEPRNKPPFPGTNGLC